MPKNKVNNYYQGNYHQSFMVNAFNPNVQKMYNAIERIQMESKQNIAHKQAGINIEIQPSCYSAMVEQGENLMFKQQAPLVTLTININVDTSKMPVEVLAKLTKVNTQAEVDKGNATNRNSNCLIEMYSTRQDYYKKIALKAQSRIDFANFKCEAKSCGRTNAHRTTLYAVIDKRSGDIKYYGSSCVNKVDGSGTIEYLQKLVNDINRFIENIIEPLKRKAKDGLDVEEILKNAIYSYQNENSKFYFGNCFFSKQEMLELALKDDDFKAILKNNLSEKLIALTQRDDKAKRILKIALESGLFELAKRCALRQKINVEDFTKWMQRSRAVGTSRSNGKALVNTLNADGKARAITATAMRNLFLLNLMNYTFDMTMQGIKENPQSIIKIVDYHLENNGILFIDDCLSEEGFNSRLQDCRKMFNAYLDNIKEEWQEESKKVPSECLLMVTSTKQDDSTSEFDLSLKPVIVHRTDEEVQIKLVPQQQKRTIYSFDNDKMMSFNRKKLVRNQDMQVVKTVLNEEWLNRYLEELKEKYDGEEKICLEKIAEYQKTSLAVKLNEVVHSFSSLIFISNSYNNTIFSLSFNQQTLIDDNIWKKFVAEKLDRGLKHEYFNMASLIKECEVTLSDDFIKQLPSEVADDVSVEDLTKECQKFVRAVTRKSKGNTLLFDVWRKRLTYKIEKGREFNSYMGYYNYFAELQIIDKKTDNKIAFMRADDKNEFQEFKVNIVKTMINSLNKYFKNKFTVSEYQRYLVKDDEVATLNNFFDNQAETENYLGRLRLNRRVAK